MPPLSPTSPESTASPKNFVESPESPRSITLQRAADAAVPFENGLNGVPDESQSEATPDIVPSPNENENSNKPKPVANEVMAVIEEMQQQQSGSARLSAIQKTMKRISAVGTTMSTAVRSRGLSTAYRKHMEELKNASSPDMKLVRKCMQFIKNTANDSGEKAALANEVRLILFNYNYPFPHCFKKLAWILLILICMACLLFSVIYGLQFDLNADNSDMLASNLVVVDAGLYDIEYNSGECWNISQKLVISQQVMLEQVVQIQNEQNEIQQVEEAHVGDWPYGDATKWLLNVLISFLQSVFSLVVV